VNNIIYKQIQDDLKNEISQIKNENEVLKISGIENIKNDFENEKNKIIKKDNFTALSKELFENIKKKTKK
jgi:hypothetical protein